MGFGYLFALSCPRTTSFIIHIHFRFYGFIYARFTRFRPFPRKRSIVIYSIIFLEYILLFFLCFLLLGSVWVFIGFGLGINIYDKGRSRPGDLQ